MIAGMLKSIAASHGQRSGGEQSAVADGFFKERGEFKKSLVGVEPFEQAVRSAPTNWSARSVADEGGRGKNRASRNLARISGTMPIIFSEVAIHLFYLLLKFLNDFVNQCSFQVFYCPLYIHSWVIIFHKHQSNYSKLTDQVHSY